MAVDANMDVDMDIDLTLDQDDEELTRLHAEAAAFDAQPTGATATDAMIGVEEVPEEGEVDANAPASKVHLRGVDDLTHNEVKNFASDHYHTAPSRVEWVDDTSVNLEYPTEAIALEALRAFSAEEEVEPLKVRAAKQLINRPGTELFVRQAVVSDIKAKNARLHSRFYLMNPKEDPESRKRRYDGPERGYRTRDYGYKRSRRDIGDDMYSRRSSRDEPFNVDLYDDSPAARAPRAPRADRRESYHSGSEYESGRRKVKYEDVDLMAHKEDGRLRNRSASPMRDGDGRFGFDDDQPRRRTARPRSRTPPRLRVGREDSANRAARDTFRKELFPERKPSVTGALTNGHTNGSGSMDLFPNHSSPPKTPRELIPNHRRKDARDIDRETREVGDAIGRYSLDGADESLEHKTYTTSDRRSSSRRPDTKPRDLFSRITGGPAPKVESQYGRLHDRPASSSTNEDTGFSFKGAGETKPRSNGNGSGGHASGFSILGASRDRVESPLVKELFPMKAGGGGANGGVAAKDLFDGRIKGRGSQRRRAEDLW